MLESKGPMAIGITKGGDDRIFAKAAITATKVIVFAEPNCTLKPAPYPILHIFFSTLSNLTVLNKYA
jgi:hypothetical protein